jgi:hypothetical protein
MSIRDWINEMSYSLKSWEDIITNSLKDGILMIQLSCL